MDIDYAIKVFKFLGLTEYQARVLYALLKKKSNSISDIAKISQVPNTRIYDIVKQLIDKNYVMQISNKPKIYRVRNVDLVLDHLLEHKQKEFENIVRDVKTLKELFKNNSNDDANQIIKLNKDVALINLLNEEISNAKESIIGFGGEELFNNSFVRSLNNARNRNVDVKIITKPVIHNMVAGNKDFIKSKEHNLNAYIIDNKKVILKLSKENEELHKVSILNNHDGIKDMLTNYFNFYWNENK